jgi:hypothetical protein
MVVRVEFMAEASLVRKEGLAVGAGKMIPKRVKLSININVGLV